MRNTSEYVRDPYRYWWQRLYGRETGFRDRGEDYIRGLLGSLLQPQIPQYGIGDTPSASGGRFHVPRGPFGGAY